MAGVDRFELPNEGVKVPCLTTWLNPYFALGHRLTLSGGAILSKPLSTTRTRTQRQISASAQNNSITIILVCQCPFAHFLHYFSPL